MFLSKKMSLTSELSYLYIFCPLISDVENNKNSNKNNFLIFLINLSFIKTASFLPLGERFFFKKLSRSHPHQTLKIIYSVFDILSAKISHSDSVEGRPLSPPSLMDIQMGI